MSRDPIILAIESSCDDTAAAVALGTKILSNTIANQKIHEKYGGVVPELASRAHQQNIIPVVDQAISRAGIKKENISAIAFGITFGLLWLATVPATNGIVAQVFGAKNLSMLFGIVFLNHQIGSFLGAYLGGVFYDMFGNYDYAWYLAIILSFVATLLHLPIDEKPIRKEATI